MPILKKHERYWGKVAIYGDYKPYAAHVAQGGDYSNFPAHSGRILDLKDDLPGAVDHFAGIIEPELSDDIVIVTIPFTIRQKRRGAFKSWPHASLKKAIGWTDQDAWSEPKNTKNWPMEVTAVRTATSRVWR